MDKRMFFSLVDKYQEGKSTSNEKALVEEYYRRLEAMGKTNLSAKEENKLKDRMYRQIVKNLEGDFKKTVIRRMPVWRKVAAAAAIFILFGTVGYFLFLNKTSNRNQAVINILHGQKDIEPGRSGAILTLESGKQIPLDSVKGAITTQGGVTVINMSGLLSYKKTQNTKEVAYNTITTSRGNQYQVLLPDGSKVWLNSSSSLRFPTSFTASNREVELTGEGYFEIVHMATTPFRVKTDKEIVEVLGTHFNINDYSDEAVVATTLLEGSVKVTAENSRESVIIKPGQQAVLMNNSQIVTREADINKVMAWKDGWFEFEQADLPTIMRQISRWYDVDIVWEGKPTSEKFGGRISKSLPLSSILQLLESNGVTDFRLEGNKLLVKP
jgi:transmembrane sensor